MKTAIYLRQSLDTTGEELGIERQRGECERLCKARGYTVVETIVDNSVSASKHGRPGYARLLDLIERQVVEVVVILRVDRLMRLNDELEALMVLVERTGVRVVTVEGDIDLSTPSGRLVARLLVSVARAEMEMKSARHRLANEQSARAGKPHGSRRPFGYNADLVTLYEPEASALREMATRVLKGHGFNEVARWANDQGYTTTTGRPFLGITICNMLKKHRYGGVRFYKGVEYKGQWEPVFDPTTWERLKLELRLRESRNVPKSRKYLLTGLLVCGACGDKMYGSLKRDRATSPQRRIYQCIGCRSVRRNADALDHFVRECVLYRLDTPELAKLLSGRDDAELTALLNEKASHEARLDVLVDDYASGLLTREQFARAKATTDACINDLADRIASKPQVGICVVSGGLCKSWETETTDWRRSLIQLLVKQILILPGVSKPVYVLDDGKRCRFDPELVEIQWIA